MSDFSKEKWQMIKNLANRLQAIRSLLHSLDEQINGQGVADELKPIQDQLQAEFDETLNALIDLIEAEDS